jgi:hypothetical protein
MFDLFRSKFQLDDGAWTNYTSKSDRMEVPGETVLGAGALHTVNYAEYSNQHPFNINCYERFFCSPQYFFLFSDF